jgi:hypothetical protein
MAIQIGGKPDSGSHLRRRFHADWFREPAGSILVSTFRSFGSLNAGVTGLS